MVWGNKGGGGYEVTITGLDRVKPPGQKSQQQVPAAFPTHHQSGTDPMRQSLLSCSLPVCYAYTLILMLRARRSMVRIARVDSTRER